MVKRTKEDKKVYPNREVTFLVTYTSEESPVYNSLIYHLRMAEVKFITKTRRVGSIGGEDVYEKALQFVTYYHFHGAYACEIVGIDYNEKKNFFTAQLP